MTKSKTWIVVADSARARIFDSFGASGPLHERVDETHPAGRLHAQDLTSDLPGRSFDRMGQGRHKMANRTNPKDREALSFAKTLASRLEKARTGGEFEKLVLIAAPKMLGLLRDALSPSCHSMVSREIAKDVVYEDAKDIEKMLA